MNEQQIQLAIYRHRDGISPFPFVITNVYLWGWESDVLYVSNAHYAIEYEIKRTHSDYLADAKKIEKHITIGKENGPSEFWYVCPTGVIGEHELPYYAGLAYVTMDSYGRTTYKVIKRAKRLKGKALSTKQIEELGGKAIDRYWRVKCSTR